MNSLLWGGIFILLFLSLFPHSSSPTLLEDIKDLKEHHHHQEQNNNNNNNNDNKNQKEIDEEKKEEQEKKRKLFEQGLMKKDRPLQWQEGDTSQMVIVRWNENLTWVRDYFPDTPATIIQKADDAVLDKQLQTKLKYMSVGQEIDHNELTLDRAIHEKKDTPYLDYLSLVKFDYVSNTARLGRECSGYIWWILENYDKLPTWNMFVHGAPEKSATIARTYLTKPRGKFQSFAGNIVNRCFEKYNGEEGRAGGEFFYEEWADLMKEIGLEPPHCMRNFCCANFVVHRDRIRILTKESWRKLLLYVLLPGKGPGWRNNCYHLEHFWHMLMGEPSHTYIGFAPHPDSQATRIISDNGENRKRWELEYRPYMKPDGKHSSPFPNHHKNK